MPVSSSCSTRPRFWRVASSRDAVDLWRPRRRASSVTPASPWLSPRASRSAAARSTERTALPSRTIRRVRPSGSAGSGRGHAAVRHRRGVAVGSGLERRVERVARRIVRTRSTMSPLACASHMNHGSRESGSGIAPRRACRSRSRRTARGPWCPVAVLGRDLLAEHDPEHRRVAGEVVRDAGRVEDLPEPVLDRAGRSRGSSRGRPCRARISSVATAAAAATRLPAYVPPWLTLSGSTLMTSAGRRTPRPGSRCPSPWRTSRGPA